MNKIVIFCLLSLVSTFSFGQGLVYEYQNGKQYCTIEIDTTDNAISGSLKALDCYEVPYYEMVFTPEIDYDEAGNLILSVTPRWHYYSFLEKLYGEVEKSQVDPKFRMKFKINNDDNTLEYISTDKEKKYIVNRTSYSNLKRMNFTKLPKQFSRTNEFKVDYRKYPKELQRKIQDRMGKLQDRMSNRTGDALFVPVQPYEKPKEKEKNEDIFDNQFD